MPVRLAAAAGEEHRICMPSTYGTCTHILERCIDGEPGIELHIFDSKFYWAQKRSGDL